MILSQNKNVSRLARHGKTVPNADVGSRDDKGDALPLIQIIICLKTDTYRGCVGRKRTRWTLFRERPPEMDITPRCTACLSVWVKTKWALEVETQIVNCVSVFIYTVRTGGQLWSGAGELAFHGWRFRRRHTQDREANMDTSGLLLQRELLLERALIIEWECLPDKGRSAGEGMEQQGETDRVDEAQRRKRTWRGPMDDAVHTRGKTERKWGRDRDRGANQFPPCQKRMYMESTSKRGHPNHLQHSKRERWNNQ